MSNEDAQGENINANMTGIMISSRAHLFHDQVRGMDMKGSNSSWARPLRIVKRQSWDAFLARIETKPLIWMVMTTLLFQGNVVFPVVTAMSRSMTSLILISSTGDGLRVEEAHSYHS